MPHSLVSAEEPSATRVHRVPHPDLTIQRRALPTGYGEAVVELPNAELHPGELAEIFAAGAGAVVVPLGGALQRLWDELVEQEEEQLPWEAPLIDIAQNYRGSSSLARSLGDVVYFQPGHHGYIARKIEIDVDEDGHLQGTPESFVQGSQTYEVPEHLIEECRALTDRIMAALTPTGRPAIPYRTAVQRLKYQAGPQELERLEAMTGNALARWGRLGFRVDVARGKLNPRLSRKGLSDALAIMTLIPACRRFVDWFNARFGDRRRAPPRAPGARIIEAPHLDERYFSALCGKRDSVCTQIFFGDRWHDLPINIDALVIIPGKLATRSFGLPPALHRVIYTGQQPAEPVQSRDGNVTVLFGAI